MFRKQLDLSSREVAFCNKHAQRYQVYRGCNFCNVEAPLPPTVVQSEADKARLQRIRDLVDGAVSGSPTNG